MNRLETIVKLQKQGKPAGICSVCSSSQFVIDAALLEALENDTEVLIEATANQVNQMGGYTGMKPADFRDYVWSRAEAIGLPKERIILGGDHLGPVAWKKQPADEAMKLAEELVYEFAKAGFTKIHLDASMPLGEEKTLSVQEIAMRTVALCKMSEAGFAEYRNQHPEAQPPVYVIGSEVPTPGGSGDEDALSVTKPEALEEMMDRFEVAFARSGLNRVEGCAWFRVIAAVVQPGVEFGNESVHDYVREEAKALADAARKQPRIVLEGHSTDYQKEEHLAEMVQDGIGILKVGPALTFAAREALFELSEREGADFIDVLDAAMLADPSNWKDHYTDEEPESTRLRKYSLSDRSRYYMNVPEVKESLARLIGDNPDKYKYVTDKVRKVLDQYWRACGELK